MRDSREAAQSAPLSLLVPGRVAPGGARCRPAGAAVVGFAYRLPSETAPAAARSTTRLEFAGTRNAASYGQARDGAPANSRLKQSRESDGTHGSIRSTALRSRSHAAAPGAASEAPPLYAGRHRAPPGATLGATLALAVHHRAAAAKPRAGGPPSRIRAWRLRGPGRRTSVATRGRAATVSSHAYPSDSRDLFESGVCTCAARPSQRPQRPRARANSRRVVERGPPARSSQVCPSARQRAQGRHASAMEARPHAAWQPARRQKRRSGAVAPLLQSLGFPPARE